MMAILLICKWAYIAYLGKQFVKDHKEYFDTKYESCLDVLQGATSPAEFICNGEI